MIDYLGWAGSTLLVAGMLIVGRKHRVGFLVGLAGESLWVVKSAVLWQLDLLVICW